jgi:polysaccharide export outer membrane protein
MRRRAAALLATVVMLTLAAARSGAQGSAVDPVFPGDRVTVRLFERGADYAVLVDERRQLDLPIVGSISVAGLTAAAVRDSVANRYLTIVRPGGVAVRVERRITVLGDVRRPDVYYIDETVRLRDAIALAGGVSEAGRPNIVRLLRDGEAREILEWRLAPEGATPLRSGDQLVVPREYWFKRNAIPLLSVIGVIGSVIITIVAR